MALRPKKALGRYGWYHFVSLRVPGCLSQAFHVLPDNQAARMFALMRNFLESLFAG
jgi:hypothetical protein